MCGSRQVRDQGLAVLLPLRDQNLKPCIPDRPATEVRSVPRGSGGFGPGAFQGVVDNLLDLSVVQSRAAEVLPAVIDLTQR